jgi:hypothetical protein
MRLEPGKKQIAWRAESPQAASVAQQEPQAPAGNLSAPREIKTPKPTVTPVRRDPEPTVAARPARNGSRLSGELFEKLSPKTVASSCVGEALQLQLPNSTVERLVQSDRFTERLGTILEEYHQPEAFEASNLDDNDLQVALIALEQFDHISLIAGAMWNGEALRTTLYKSDIREMVDLLGRETLAFAIVNALQPPNAAPSPKPLEAIRLDGAACFYAWAASVPKAIKQRMELRQPSLFQQIPEPEEAFLVSGPSILRKAAQYVLSSNDE